MVFHTIFDNFFQIFDPLTGTPKKNCWDKFWTNLGFGAFLIAVRGKKVSQCWFQKLFLSLGPYPKYPAVLKMLRDSKCTTQARKRHININSVQTRCIVKGEAQKSPLFWRFSVGFCFSEERLFSKNSTGNL